NRGRLKVVQKEGQDFSGKIEIEHRLYIAAMKRVRALVVKTQSVDRVHRVELDLPAVNEITERTNQSLSFEFPLVACAGRKSQQRRAPVTVHHHTQFQAQPVRIPAMHLFFHSQPQTAPTCRRRRCKPREFVFIKEARVCQRLSSFATMCRLKALSQTRLRPL